MTRQTVDYSRLPDGERQQKATNDLIAYLGLEKYQAISKDVRSQPISRQSFINQLDMFAGISGYPAEVWADDLGLKKET